MYLPEDVARQHPLYGVFGWALILLAFLFVAPLALVFQDVRLLSSGQRIPQTFWFVLAIDGLLLLCAWMAALKLGREQLAFLPWFLIAALVGLGSAALFFVILTAGVPAEYQDRGSLGLVVRGLPVILWVAYVLFSRRIAVTVRKRTRVDDPFLRAQWMADRPTGLRPTGARGTIYARPYRATPVERQSNEDGVQPAPPAAAEVTPPPAEAAVAPETPALTPQPGRPVYPPVTTTTTVRAPNAFPVHALPVAQQAAGRPSVPPPPRLSAMADDDDETLTHRRRRENSLVLDRLRRLQIAHEEGLISEPELRMKRSEILREL